MTGQLLRDLLSVLKWRYFLSFDILRLTFVLNLLDTMTFSIWSNPQSWFALVLERRFLSYFNYIYCFRLFLYFWLFSSETVAAAILRAEFHRETQEFSQKKQCKIDTFIEINEGKQKKGKGNSRLFGYKTCQVRVFSWLLKSQRNAYVVVCKLWADVWPLCSIILHLLPMWKLRTLIQKKLLDLFKRFTVSVINFLSL